MKTTHQRSEQQLMRLQAKFEQWRTSKKSRCIPPHLVEEAAQLAPTLGIGRVAALLGLNFSRLKQRVQGKRSTTVKVKESVSPQLSIVEVPLEGLAPVQTSKGCESRLFFKFKSRLGIVKIEWI